MGTDKRTAARTGRETRGSGEIRLAALQRGSTIMSVKVNPVVPEMVIQCGIRVMANDCALTIAASRRRRPLLESLELLCRVSAIFRTKCVEMLEAVPERCAALLDASLAFAAAYVPCLGYDAVSGIIIEENGGMRRKSGKRWTWLAARIRDRNTGVSQVHFRVQRETVTP